MARIFKDNSFAIGNTPLVQLHSITDGGKANVLAKMEGRNPGLLGEMPHWCIDDMGCREAWAAQARHGTD